MVLLKLKIDLQSCCPSCNVLKRGLRKPFSASVAGISQIFPCWHSVPPYLDGNKIFSHNWSNAFLITQRCKRCFYKLCTGQSWSTHVLKFLWMKHRCETAGMAGDLQGGIALACHQSVRCVSSISWVFLTAVTIGGEFGPIQESGTGKCCYLPGGRDYRACSILLRCLSF